MSEAEIDRIEEKEEVKSLEELLAETEQKITNNKFEKDTSIDYHGTRLEFRMKIITQAAFEKTSKLFKKQDATTNRQILEEYLINKETSKPFTSEQIKTLFTGGLTGALALKILDESDFNLDEIQQRQMRNFLKRST